MEMEHTANRANAKKSDTPENAAAELCALRRLKIEHTAEIAPKAVELQQNKLSETHRIILPNETIPTIGHYAPGDAPCAQPASGRSVGNRPGAPLKTHKHWQTRVLPFAEANSSIFSIDPKPARKGWCFREGS